MGRKWRAEEAVQEAEARLHHRSLVGVVTRGQAELGSFPTPQKNTRGKERQCLVQEEVRAAVEEARSCEAVGKRHQGAWTRWENVVERKVTWTEIWKAEPHHIKFLIRAVYDVLPSPSNLHTWGIAETPACPLCSKRDIVLVSESTKQAVLLELTVPWEAHLEEAFERKLSKYEGLVSDRQQAGWRARCLPVEVGCRGFVAHSMARALSSLGIMGEQKRRAIRYITKAAERASRWLWLKRGEPWSHGS
ncbi:hypothetical protein SRHO_G00066000 [Serrasalmus rhombeus]